MPGAGCCLIYKLDRILKNYSSLSVGLLIANKISKSGDLKVWFIQKLNALKSEQTSKPLMQENDSDFVHIKRKWVFNLDFLP